MVGRVAIHASVLAAGFFIVMTALKAIRSPWMVDDFPEALAIKAELMPVIFPVHMITGGLVLILVPLTVLTRLRPRWHRWAGRITAAVVVPAGLTAFPVALIEPVTWASALGFTMQGALWLVLLGLGITHIRAGRVARHRACMLLMAAATSGAVFFRIYLALFALWGSPRFYEVFYACDAWIAWGLPVLATAFFLKRTGAWAAERQ